VGEKPRAAIEAKPDASLLVAMRAVAAGEADALVSAGSTGALVLAAAQLLPRIPGIERAALAAVYPTRKRDSSSDPFALLLDVGASVRVRSHDLLFFAYMGSAYARAVSKTARPTIGLLNMGSEASKGDAPLRQAHAWTRDDPRMNFVKHAPDQFHGQNHTFGVLLADARLLSALSSRACGPSPARIFL